MANTTQDLSREMPRIDLTLKSKTGGIIKNLNESRDKERP